VEQLAKSILFTCGYASENMPHSGYPFVERIPVVLFAPSGATRDIKRSKRAAN